MRKSIFPVAFGLILIGGLYISTNHFQKDLSALEAANIEALTEVENPLKDCHYVNGYKNWYIDPPYENCPRQGFYNCCAEKVTGYEPYGSCI